MNNSIKREPLSMGLDLLMGRIIAINARVGVHYVGLSNSFELESAPVACADVAASSNSVGVSFTSHDSMGVLNKRSLLFVN